MKLSFFKITFILLFCFPPLYSFGRTDSGLNDALKSFQDKDYELSKKQFEALIKNDNKNAVYWFNLGHVFTKLGKPDSALKADRIDLVEIINQNQKRGGHSPLFYSV
jgi:hypothetical protein